MSSTFPDSRRSAPRGESVLLCRAALAMSSFTTFIINCALSSEMPEMSLLLAHAHLLAKSHQVQVGTPNLESFQHHFADQYVAATLTSPVLQTNNFLSRDYHTLKHSNDVPSQIFTCVAHINLRPTQSFIHGIIGVPLDVHPCSPRYNCKKIV